jgi:glycyl-tRNA synthetase beta subunit
MGKELLFEIGTEEIPSGYLPAALEDLKAVARRLLAEHDWPATPSARWVRRAG